MNKKIPYAPPGYQRYLRIFFVVVMVSFLSIAQKFPAHLIIFWLLLVTFHFYQMYIELFKFKEIAIENEILHVPEMLPFYKIRSVPLKDISEAKLIQATIQPGLILNYQNGKFLFIRGRYLKSLESFVEDLKPRLSNCHWHN